MPSRLTSSSKPYCVLGGSRPQTNTTVSIHTIAQREKLILTSIKRKRFLIHSLDRILHSNGLGIGVRHFKLQQIEMVDSIRIDDVPGYV